MSAIYNRSGVSIETLKAKQKQLGLGDRHLVYLGEFGFRIAHTNKERSSGDLENCELHQWLLNLDGPPTDIGIWVVEPHMPDLDSESYGAIPWDFNPIDTYLQTD